MIDIDCCAGRSGISGTGDLYFYVIRPYVIDAGKISVLHMPVFCQLAYGEMRVFVPFFTLIFG